jgi:cytidylate kinase
MTGFHTTRRALDPHFDIGRPTATGLRRAIDTYFDIAVDREVCPPGHRYPLPVPDPERLTARSPLRQTHPIRQGSTVSPGLTGDTTPRTKAPRKVIMPARVTKVVAISRAIGAEGERIGALVSERLGFRYVDEEIITRAAEKQGVDPSMIADAERRKSVIQRVLEGLGQSGAAGAIPGGATWVPDDSSELAQSHDLRDLIRETIHETAARGDVVIVAHAAAFALAGRDDLLRVLITAPVEIRTRRLAEARGADEAQAAKELKRSDEARAAYLKTFYGVERELPTHYDLVLNTETLEPDAAAGVVARAAGA